MSEKLKPCPFCGDARVKQYGGFYSQEAETTSCLGCFTQVIGHNLWNNRPYENKIKADAVREAIRLNMISYNDSYVKKLLAYADKIERGE